MLDGMSEDMSESMSEDMLKRMSKHVSKRLLEGCFQSACQIESSRTHFRIMVVCLPSPDTINLISNQMWLFYNVMVWVTRSKVFFLVPGPLYNPLMPWSVRPRHLVLYCVVLCSSWCPGPPFFCCCFLSQIVFCFVLLFVLYISVVFRLRFFCQFRFLCYFFSCCLSFHGFWYVDIFYFHSLYFLFVFSDSVLLVFLFLISSFFLLLLFVSFIVIICFLVLF